ncbi:hypothetical protein VTN77DRAFT_802 [Rasamsonia byssochlamydoides]|uniref:uncharacterized protein n=1 Tax=Rasamsonia byssochlamydoides TaxID=89139 RepID=UPI00374240FA
MTEATFRSHHDIVRQRGEQFEASLQRGEFHPLLLQQVVGTFLLLLIPLLIPHRNRQHSLLLRYGFFSIIVCLSVYTIYAVRAISLANGYSVGLVTSWFLVWSATLLIFNDVQRDFKRIERKVVDAQSRHNKEEPEPNGSSEPIEKSESIDGRESSLRLHRTKHSPIREASGPQERIVYRWQPYPRSFGHRLDWVMDLIFNFRGPEWNWRVRGLPPIPDSVTKDLRGEAPISEMGGSQAVQDPWTRLRLAFYTMLRNYIALDVIKVLMNRDPYFWGVIEPSPPPPFPFHFLAFSPLLVRSYRLLLSLIGVCCALQFVTAFNPICFLGLSLTFPRLARAITDQPLDEGWLYPEIFGPVSFALDHGLAGCWSLWWHQMFRFGFAETARFLSDLLLPGDGSHKSRQENARRAIEVLVAFCISGLVHACGSYTQFAITKPSGPILFFVLQAPAILVQRFLSRTVLPRLLPFKPPCWLRRATNLAFVVAWFLYTGPFIVDDFSRGGMWLFEPVPVSPLRGMGFGGEGDGWLCWAGPSFRWWEGKTWWQSGIRIV